MWWVGGMGQCAASVHREVCVQQTCIEKHACSKWGSMQRETWMQQECME